MDIRLKWFYRLGFLLLFFILLLIFIKLQPIWLPFVKILMVVFLPFIIAAFITYLLHPIVERIHEGGLHRGLAVGIIYVLFFGGIGFAVYKGLPEMIKQLKDLSESVPELANQYMGFIDMIQKKTETWPDGIQERVNESIIAVEQKLALLLEKTLSIIFEIIGAIFTIAIIPFISFYMLKDYTTIKKVVWYLTPRKWRQGGAHFLRDVDKSLGSYIRGQLFVCVVIGTLSATLFWIFNMKYPLLLGLIIGITNVIPYFGPVIGAIPAVIIASALSVKMILITVCIIAVMQFLEGNILSPLIVGKSLDMHPLVIMLALLLGGEIGGIIGLIVSIPILAVLKVGFVHIRKYIIDKHTAEL